MLRSLQNLANRSSIYFGMAVRNSGFAMVAGLATALLLTAASLPLFGQQPTGELMAFVPGWGEVTDPAGDCTFVGADGRLTIAVPGTLTPHDLDPRTDFDNLSGPRVLRNVAGEFRLQVKVHPYTLPNSNTTTSTGTEKASYISAGLLVWLDDRTFVKCQRAANGERGEAWVHLQAYQDAQLHQVTHVPGNARNVNMDEATYLRVERQGNELTFSASVDGKKWATIGIINDIELPLRIRVGLGVVNATNRAFSAEFGELLLASELPISVQQTAGDSPLPIAAMPADSTQVPKGPSIDPIQHSGLFVGDDPQFPFVMQVEMRDDLTVVRGMGRMAYSADDPTLILAEFVGISAGSNHLALRGVLALQPDGKRLTERKLSPLVGLYDSSRDDWNMMLSPQHVISANRPGMAANRGIHPGAANVSLLSIDSLVAANNRLEQVFHGDPSASNQLAMLNQMQTDAQAAVIRAQTDLPTDVKASLAATRSSLGANWNQAMIALVVLGESLSKERDATDPSAVANPFSNDNVSPIGQGTRFLFDVYSYDPPNRVDNLPTPANAGLSAGNSAVAAPTTPTNVTSAPDLWVGRSLDEFMQEQIHRGVADDQISYTLVPAPDAALAWQIAGVTRDINGRIIGIVNYGSAPDVPNAAQGGAGTIPGGSPPTAPANPIGNSASTGGPGSPPSGGSGTPPGGTSGTGNPDSTTRVVNADGSNRVPGSPPNVTAPSEPGGTNPPQWAPAPAVPTIPPVTPGRTVTQVPSRRQGDGTVYDPNITILVNEDSTDGDAARFNAARAALNRAQGDRVHVQAKGPGMEAENHADGTPADPAEPRGFQPGDAAVIGAGFREGSMTPGGSLVLAGHEDRDHEGIWFNIFSTTLPNTVENAIRHNQEYWKPPAPQDDDDATVTLHRYEMSDTEGVLHFVRDVHVNAEATSCAYHHFVIYQGFLIGYGHNVSGRIVHDVGRDWPNILRNAQQLIDRRFPPAKPGAEKNSGNDPHPLDGTWESSVPNGVTLQFGLTVQGNIIRMAMNPNGDSRVAGIPTIEGTMSGDANGFSGTLSTPGPNGEGSVPFTMTLSQDQLTMTVSSAGTTQTWHRK